jgi:formylglycine-generating enzyme required for sulfatase activity
MPTPQALSSWSAWDTLDDASRRKVVSETAKALGPGYKPTKLVGERKMGCVKHVPTGYEFLLMPGGSFSMGITEAEEERILDVLRTLGGFPDAPKDERGAWEKRLKREVRSIATAARPVHDVSVAPFLCGRRHLGETSLAPAWRALCEAEWEYVARASYLDGWLLHPPLTWGNENGPGRALTQESPLGFFDLVSWAGEGFPEDGWAGRGGYQGAPSVAGPFTPEGGELDWIARGGPTNGWASEVAGVWAFFAGARSNACGTGRRAAISFT